MRTFSIKDIFKEGFDFSTLELKNEEIDDIFLSFFSSVEKWQHNAQIKYNHAIEKAKSEGWANPLLRVRSPDYLDKWPVFKEGVYQIISDKFGMEKFKICLLFSIENRNYFLSNYMENYENFNQNEFFKTYYHSEASVAYDYLNKIASNNSIARCLAMNRNDLSDIFLVEALQRHVVSLNRSLEIINHNLEKATFTGANIVVAENAIMRYFTLLPESLLISFYERHKKYLSTAFKIELYKKVGYEKHIDEMISDESHDVRLAAVNFLDPTDPRMMSFSKDTSKRVFDAALIKADISFMPYFMASKHLKKSDTKLFFQTRMDDGY